MKNYISAEEFLSLDKEVQKVFIDCIKPQEGDLYSTRSQYDVFDVVVFTDGRIVQGMERDFIIGPIKIDYDYIPLLQMHQLIAFIEEKTESKIDIKYNKIGYKIYLNELDTFMITDKDNILDALFETCVEFIKCSIVANK